MFWPRKWSWLVNGPCVLETNVYLSRVPLDPKSSTSFLSFCPCPLSHQGKMLSAGLIILRCWDRCLRFVLTPGRFLTAASLSGSLTLRLQRVHQSPPSLLPRVLRAPLGLTTLCCKRSQFLCRRIGSPGVYSLLLPQESSRSHSSDAGGRNQGSQRLTPTLEDE